MSEICVRDVDFGRYTVKLTGPNEDIVNSAATCTLLQNWMNSIDRSICVRSITIQNFRVDGLNRIIYLKLSTISVRNGSEIPRIVVLEGNEISVLLMLTEQCTGKEYCLLIDRVIISTGTRQYIVPFELTRFEEPTEQYAAQFIHRLCGLETEPSKYVNTIKATKGEAYVHSECGPSDHRAYMFLYRAVLPKDDIMSLSDKEIEPNVYTRIVDVNDIHDKVNDFLSISALLFAEKYNEINSTKIN